MLLEIPDLFDLRNSLPTYVVLYFFPRVDYIIAPLKVLQSLKESVATPGEKHSFVRRLSPENAAIYNFRKEEVWFLLQF